MKNEIVTFRDESWFIQLVEEVQAAIEEMRFGVQNALITGKHAIGEAIHQHRGNRPALSVIKPLAATLKVSERSLEQCYQFYRADPALTVLEQGKNISWRKVLAQIQRPIADRHKECAHDGEIIVIKICGKCGSRLSQ